MRRDRRRPFVLWGAIAALVAMTLAAASAGFVATTDTASDTESTTSTTVALNAEARELLALLEKDRAATFHAKYTASSKQQPNAVIEVETWRKPPKVRQDTVVSANGSKMHTIAYVLDGSAIQCARLGESAWSCQSKPGEQIDELLFADVRERLGRGPVTAKDDVIDGRRVRCFTMTVVADKTTSELCATEAGVPVRVTSPTASLRLIGFDQTVNDEVFVPPASPAPAPGQ